MYSEDARISTLRVRIKKYFRVDKFVFLARFTQVARYMMLRNGDKTRLATTAEGRYRYFVCCLASLSIYLMYLRSVWLYPLVFDRIDGVLI